MRMRVVILAIAAFVARSAGAETCRVAPRNTSAVVAQNGLTIAPFAIPVAVPVATISQPAVFYGYSQYRSAAPAAARPVESPPPNASAILQQRCAACHAGPNAKAGFSLTMPAQELPRDRRLGILDRVTSSDLQRRMPLGEPPLTQDELRAVLNELVR